ncbi:MAG TPA: hypothetical protein VJ715_02295 [Pyrinomonadaceae bacterium]|nr:hypothetical protein [Pyrinomonadaceae bacterium]
MQDILRHQRFTRQLGRFSDRLDDLMLELRRFEPAHVPAELLDEMASTLGELMLVLIEHKDSDGAKTSTGRAASDAQHLREAMRLGQLQYNQITEALGTLRQELGVVIHEDKQAA